jgi:7-cyano-7-deazaguanine synthase in queuosine biosynthesis
MIDDARKKILCMFSGGVDSTGVLYFLLNDEKYINYDIHVHFIKIINRENRYEAETIAVRSCIEWFGKHSREFLYSENIVEFSFLKRSFPWDVDIINFVTAEIVANLGFDYEFRSVGRTKTDTLSYSGVPDYEQANKIVDVILEGYNKKIERIFPVIDMTKKEIWDMLPKELRTKTWSCRTPILKDNNYIPCNNCHTCKQLKEEGIIL